MGASGRHLIHDKINIILSKGTDLNITRQKFIAANRFDKPKQIVELSEYVMHQQNKLLGHVIRAGKLDPMRLPTIDSKLHTPGVVVRRTGKPRLRWVKENCKWVCKKVLERMPGRCRRTSLYPSNCGGCSGQTD